MVRSQLVKLGARIERADLVRSPELRAILSDLGILRDMAFKVYEHLPRPDDAGRNDDNEE